MLKSDTVPGWSVMLLDGRKEHDLNHSVIRTADILLLVYDRISGRFIDIHLETSRVQGT